MKLILGLYNQLHQYLLYETDTKNSYSEQQCVDQAKYNMVLKHTAEATETTASVAQW